MIGVYSNNLQVRFVDFHVPLWSFVTLETHSSIYLGLSLTIV